MDKHARAAYRVPPLTKADLEHAARRAAERAAVIAKERYAAKRYAVKLATLKRDAEKRRR